MLCALAASLLAAALLAWLPGSAAHAQGTDAAASAAPATPPQAADPLAGRVGKLEGQISDLQVMIGTLESLLRETPSATLQHETAPAPAADSALAPRVEALETQIGALTSQLERIGKQLASIEAKLDGATPQDEPEDDAPQGLRQGLAPIAPWATASTASEQAAPGARWYGPPPGEPSPQQRIASASRNDAETLYQQAYGNLLEENYPAAEAAFRQFLEAHPNDKLAGNAQFWLGETYFARGDFKGAADAFLKGYQTYGKSEKAPDALLKLAMSLSALGEKQEACSTFGELEAKYPTAPQAVRDQARAARAKAGC